MSDNYPAKEPTFMVDNPLAGELSRKFAEQLDALLANYGLIVHHSHGRTAGYTASDAAAKMIRIEVRPSRFDVDITGELNSQVSAGLRAIADQLRDDADRIEQDQVFQQPSN